MFNNQNEKAVFVKAEVKESQAGNLYVWSRTFDLTDVVRELGTSCVTITMIKPKKARSDSERLIIIKAGDPKFVSKNNGNGGTKRPYTNGHSDDADNSLI